MSEKLKPCPFCSGESVIRIEFSRLAYQRVTREVYTPRCTICSANHGYYKTKDEAITAWNTRPAEALADELGEALEEAIKYINDTNRYRRCKSPALTKWKESRNDK